MTSELPRTWAQAEAQWAVSQVLLNSEYLRVHVLPVLSVLEQRWRWGAPPSAQYTIFYAAFFLIMKRFFPEGGLINVESLINKMILKPISNGKQSLEKRGLLGELNTTMDGIPMKQI